MSLNVATILRNVHACDLLVVRPVTQRASLECAGADLEPLSTLKLRSGWLLRSIISNQDSPNNYFFPNHSFSFHSTFVRTFAYTSARSPSLGTPITLDKPCLLLRLARRDRLEATENHALDSSHSRPESHNTVTKTHQDSSDVQLASLVLEIWI